MELQCEPSAHDWHSVCPTNGLNKPIEQGWQEACPPVFEKRPAAQLDGAVLPVGLKKPGSVGVQSAALVRSVALEYVPARHGSAADAPALQYEPASHALHAVAPSAS
eukprot:4461461-Prymnesium_polylepis.1